MSMKFVTTTTVMLEHTLGVRDFALAVPLRTCVEYIYGLIFLYPHSGLSKVFLLTKSVLSV